MEKKCPLSKDEFYNLSLLAVFALICSRSGQSNASVTYLTLRYQWGPRHAILLNKAGGDRHWQEVKEEIKDEYLNAREELPKKGKFEVWIKSGDRINLEHEEDEEDF